MNTANLKEIKSRYAGKCEKCGRDIREGWTVMFDPGTKNVYCMPCFKAEGGTDGVTSGGSVVCESCQESVSAEVKFCPNCGSAVYHPPTMEELVEQIISGQTAMFDAFGDISKQVSETLADFVGKYQANASAVHKVEIALEKLTEELAKANAKAAKADK